MLHLLYLDEAFVLRESEMIQFFMQELLCL